MTKTPDLVRATELPSKGTIDTIVWGLDFPHRSILHTLNHQVVAEQPCIGYDCNWWTKSFDPIFGHPRPVKRAFVTRIMAEDGEVLYEARNHEYPPDYDKYLDACFDARKGDVVGSYDDWKERTYYIPLAVQKCHAYSTISGWRAPGIKEYFPTAKDLCFAMSVG